MNPLLQTFLHTESKAGSCLWAGDPAGLLVFLPKPRAKLGLHPSQGKRDWICWAGSSLGKSGQDMAPPWHVGLGCWGVMQAVSPLCHPQPPFSLTGGHWQCRRVLSMEVTGPPNDIDVAIWDSCWRTVGFSISPNHPSRCLLNFPSPGSSSGFGGHLSWLECLLCENQFGNIIWKLFTLREENTTANTVVQHGSIWF